MLRFSIGQPEAPLLHLVDQVDELDDRDLSAVAQVVDKPDQMLSLAVSSGPPLVLGTFFGGLILSYLLDAASDLLRPHDAPDLPALSNRKEPLAPVSSAELPYDRQDSLPCPVGTEESLDPRGAEEDVPLQVSLLDFLNADVGILQAVNQLFHKEILYAFLKK